MAFAQIAGRGWFLSPRLFAKTPPLAEIRDCFLYFDRSRQLILKFKHGDALHLSPLFTRFLQAPFTALAESDHLIVPIQLHAKRYLHRRLNQSAELAPVIPAK